MHGANYPKQPVYRNKWLVEEVNILYTVNSRKVVGKICTPQSRMLIWDMIDTLFLTTFAVEPTFVLALANTFSWPFVQILSKNSKLKTTHSAFRDCRVHFFRRTFSK